MQVSNPSKREQSDQSEGLTKSWPVPWGVCPCPWSTGGRSSCWVRRGPHRPTSVSRTSARKDGWMNEWETDRMSKGWIEWMQSNDKRMNWGKVVEYEAWDGRMDGWIFKSFVDLMVKRWKVIGKIMQVFNLKKNLNIWKWHFVKADPIF